jgi:hypothetical protein
VKRRASYAGIALSILAHASSAHAQSAPDLASAQALFDEGKRLLDQGDYDAACPKLAASLRLDVGIGTMLYLADCEAHRGRTATAWAQFREAAAVAASQHDAREKVARSRAADLEPRLSRLVIAVAEPAAPQLVVKRDGEPLDRAAWGIGVPVDPGPHVVEASAPGRAPFRASVAVAGDARTLTVTVPALESTPAPIVAPSAPGQVASDALATLRVGAADRDGAPSANAGSESSPSRPLGARRIFALAAAGVGAVALGLGTYWAVRAKGDLDDSNSDGHCHGNACDAYGVDARADAGSQASLATIGYVAGGVAVAAGAVLWLTAPRASVHVALAPGGVRDPGLVVMGSF